MGPHHTACFSEEMLRHLFKKMPFYDSKIPLWFFTSYLGQNERNCINYKISGDKGKREWITCLHNRSLAVIDSRVRIQTPICSNELWIKPLPGRTLDFFLPHFLLNSTHKTWHFTQQVLSQTHNITCLFVSFTGAHSWMWFVQTNPGWLFSSVTALLLS